MPSHGGAGRGGASSGGLLLLALGLDALRGCGQAPPRARSSPGEAEDPAGPSQAPRGLQAGDFRAVCAQDTAYLGHACERARPSRSAAAVRFPLGLVQEGAGSEVVLQKR